MWTLNFLSRLEFLAPLMLRGIVGGSFFFVHGMNKIRPAGVWDWGKGFASAPIASEALLYIAAWTEFLGGAALLLGLFTRWAALGLAGIMAYAVFGVHWHQGFALHAAGGSLAGYEFAATFGIASLCLVFLGPGKLSLDFMFFRKEGINE